jgi:hypothetical protein
MTDNERNESTDYSALLRSPYDPDPEPEDREEGTSELSWKGPVIGAILGALIVSAFVVYAASVRSSEGAAQPVDVTTTSTTVAAPVASTGLPEGYEPVTAAVGARVETVDVSSRGTVLAVTTAVTGGEDPASVPPLDVAYWELELAESSVYRMTGQRQHLGALGNITVEFEPIAALRQPSLIAYPAEGSVVSVVAPGQLDGTVPQTLTDLVFDLDSGSRLIVESLDIGDGWGWIAWRIEGDVPARVDTVVTFIGTDDPQTPDVEDATTLTNPHLRALAQGTGTIPLPPLYAFSMSEQLVRDGEPLSGSNAPTAIRVDFTITQPESIGEPVDIFVPPSP